MAEFRFGRWNLEEFERIRKSDGMQAHLDAIGEVTKARCNAELHAAQAARKQPQEDGYEATVVADVGDRARLFITPTTARAMAHEAVNHSILKNLPMGTTPVPPDHSVPKELGRRGNEAQGRGSE